MSEIKNLEVYKMKSGLKVMMVSSAAFNAFLKTLEEPPAHVVFILAALYFSTKLVGFAIKGIMDCGARQDGFASFIAVKR